MVTVEPIIPIVGLKLVMVGWPFPVDIVKFAFEVAVPPGVVSVIGPVTDPLGTTTAIWFTVADVGVAFAPPNETPFWLAVELNPVPVIITVEPTGPLVGTKLRIETCPAVERPIANRLPTGSNA